MAKIAQTSGKRTCSQFLECSISLTKVVHFKRFLQQNAQFLFPTSSHSRQCPCLLHFQAHPMHPTNRTLSISRCSVLTATFVLICAPKAAPLISYLWCFAYIFMAFRTPKGQLPLARGIALGKHAGRETAPCKGNYILCTPPQTSDTRPLFSIFPYFNLSIFSFLHFNSRAPYSRLPSFQFRNSVLPFFNSSILACTFPFFNPSIFPFSYVPFHSSVLPFFNFPIFLRYYIYNKVYPFVSP